MTIFTHACLFNPVDCSWNLQSFAVENGRVTALDPVAVPSGETVVDLQGKRVIPGLIDAHVHIESSLLIPREFGRLVLSHGVTTAICDPHEIANVAGVAGIDFMLADAKYSPADLFFMVPSCVPATPLEVGGAVVTAKDLEKYVGNPAVLGLGEMMNVPGVLADDPEVCAKLALFSHVDGHAPGLSGHDLKRYADHGISTDHECSTPEEVEERLGLGMYVFLREGDAAKNVASLVSAVTPENAGKCAFCTDDRHADSIAREGTIDNCIRIALGSGLPLELALRMATLSAAEAVGLSDRGCIAPGKIADFCVLDDRAPFKITAVYKNGRKAEDTPVDAPVVSAGFAPVVTPDLSAVNLTYPAGAMKCIAVTDGSLLTDAVRVSSTDPGLNKLLCIDRYRGDKVGFCPVKGLCIRKGAIAESIMHDAHHIMAAGTQDADILQAVSAVVKAGGGMAVAVDGSVTLLPLPVGGLMTTERYESVCVQLAGQGAALQKTGANPHAFMSLAFLGLTVIPHLKLTPRGLFDGDRFTDVPLEW
ncbi:MAG TPA: adenine deaminase [Methanocorpusculum sp.]|nr:adenine deaminase [Methanocorpusculum sp.]